MIYFIFLSFSDEQIVQVIQWFFMKDMDPLIQSINTKWAGDTRSHTISSSCIDLILPKYHSPSTKEINYSILFQLILA